MSRCQSFASLLLLLTLASLGRATEIVYPVNNGFEQPDLGAKGYGYGIANVFNLGVGGLPSAPPGWTFAGTTGISANGSGFGTTGATNGNSDGTTSTGGQAAFIQNGYGAGAPDTITQNVTLPGGFDSVTLSIELRGSNNASVDVSLGGIDLGTYKPLSGSSFNTVTTTGTNLPAGTYALVLTGVDSQAGVDNTVFVDNVSITSIPEPAGIATLAIGAAGLLLIGLRRVGVRGGRSSAMRGGVACLALVAVLCTQDARAAFLVDPSTTTSVASSEYSTRTLADALNGNGLIPATTYPTGTAVPATWAAHDTNPDGEMYLSNGVPTPTITFDLGQQYSLTGFHLWNYNESYVGGPDLTNRGILTADVRTSTNGIAYTDLGTMTFARGTGTGDTGETYSLPTPISAEFVQFIVSANQGVDPRNGDPDAYTGISEIRFIATPEPSSIILCVLGAIALVLAARRRKA